MDQEKTLQIGKINLDLTHYPGEDLYCDGDIEDTLLDIARNYSTVEYPRIIEEKRQWEILYHLSLQRENIIEWLPFDQRSKVLEVGAGCGAVTGALSARAGSVTCVDLSKKRSMINAYRHMDQDNIHIMVGNFTDVEPDLNTDFDYILLIGVFEYGQAYIPSETPFDDFLEILKKHLKPEGHLVISIENRMGMKYLAGCKEDHLGDWFSGVEGYPRGGVVRTFTKPELEQILQRNGITEYSFYYPYPDYKFMTQMYSDDYLPKVGELSDNIRNFDRDRWKFFDEKLAFDSLTEAGEFPYFSNSFLVVTGPEISTRYVKYSNDRQRQFQIKTEISLENRLGYHTETRSQLQELKSFVVRKYPMLPDSFEHIRSMEQAYKELRERYKGSDFKINRCHLVETEEQKRDGRSSEEILKGEAKAKNLRPYVELEFLEGQTLSELMDLCLEKGDQNGFDRLFDKYLEFVSFRSDYPAADYDCIFSNILITPKDASLPFDPIENGIWNLIDYEWTFGKQVDPRELAFRAIYCYILEDKKRDKLELDHILTKLDLSDHDAEEFRGQELEFQRYVTGNHRSMKELRDLLRQDVHDPYALLDRQKLLKKRGLVQIYESFGRDFQAEYSYYVDDPRVLTYEEQDYLRRIKIRTQADMTAIRLDPAISCCIVKLLKATYRGVELPLLTGPGQCIITSGNPTQDPQVFAFTDEDPRMVFDLVRIREMLGTSALEDPEEALEVEWEITFLPPEMAGGFVPAPKPKRRFHF